MLEHVNNKCLKMFLEYPLIQFLELRSVKVGEKYVIGEGILTNLSFYVLLSGALALHPPFEISVPNDYPPNFSNCTHDVTQVLSFYDKKNHDFA